MIRVVVLVPRRADHGWRDRLWRFCRDWWLDQHPEWPLYEGESPPGPFNRSAAINRAAAAADADGRWDVAVIIDSDIIADPKAVRAIVDVARTTNRMAVSHTERVMLGRQMTEQILDGYRGSWGNGTKVWRDSCSCCIAVSRELWEKNGGFDEAYVGWGFEDSAFGALSIYHAGPVHFERSRLFHLWHEESPEAHRKSETRLANERRLRALARRIEGWQKPTAIPPILHRTVPAETSPEVEAFWQRFADLHPEWELRTYRDPIDGALFPKTAPLWGRCENGAQKAGLIRLEALVTWGGVYVDSDVEPFRPFDPLLGCEAFCGWEDEKVIPDAVLGARPGHPAFVLALDRAIAAVKARKGAWESGPGVTTRTLQGRGDVLCLPPGSLYPYHYLEKARRGDAPEQPWAFCAHHWHHSWGSDAERARIEAAQR